MATYTIETPVDKPRFYMINNIIGLYGENLIENYSKILKHISKFINNGSETLQSRNPGLRLLYTNGTENDFYDACGIEKSELIKIIKASPNIPSHAISDQTDPLYNLCMCMICLYYKNQDYFKTIFDGQKFMDPYRVINIYLTLRIYSKMQLHIFKFIPNEDTMEYVVNNLNNRFELASVPNLYTLLNRYADTNNNALNIDFNNIPDETIWFYVSKLKSRMRSFLAKILQQVMAAKEAGDSSKVQGLQSTDKEGKDYYLTVDNISSSIEIISKKILNKFVQDRELKKSLLNIACKKTQIGLDSARIMIENIRDSKDEKLLIALINDIISYWIVSQKQTAQNIHSKYFIISCSKAYAISNTKDDFVLDLKNNLQEILNKYSEIYSKTSRKATLSSFKQCVFLYLVMYISTIQ